MYFSTKSLKFFCKIHSIVHLTSPSYHPRWKGIAERCIDIFKGAIMKANRIETVNEELQKFLSIYRITPNVNASSGMAPAVLMFARKICLIFDRLRPTDKIWLKEKIPMVNITTPVKKYISRIINLEK